MALVAGDHQTSVAVAVGHLNVGAMSHQVFHNFVVSIEARGSERRRVCLGGRVYIGTVPN